MLDPQILEQAAVILGHQFKDPRILTEALTHASIAGHRLQSNERMEFLGDAVLGYVISEYLFRAFPQYLEGELTKIKSAVVSRKVCALVSQKLNLAAMLDLGKGMSGRPGLPSSVSAAVLESVIAAIFLDGGMEPAQRFILEHLSPLIDELVASTHQHNYKSVLQQHAQRYLPGNPVYVLLDEKGPDHSKAFEVCVEIGGRRFPSAWANAKKEAEQMAALNALCDLNVVTCNAAGLHVLRERFQNHPKPQDAPAAPPEPVADGAPAPVAAALFPECAPAEEPAPPPLPAHIDFDRDLRRDDADDPPRCLFD